MGDAKRAFFAFTQSRRLRHQLKAYLKKDSLYRIKSVTELTPKWLEIRGISALVLDFDGVLGPHGALFPTTKVLHWLQSFLAKWSPRKIFILSNKPTRARRQYFAEKFPELEFIKATRKKPYPDGLLEIVVRSGLPAGKIALVDDRLLTGVLAAELAKTRAIYLTNALIDWRGRTVAEVFFNLMRGLEKIYCRLN